MAKEAKSNEVAQQIAAEAAVKLDHARSLLDGPLANYKEALRALREASKLGSPEAQFALGTWYLHGTHVGRNTRRAVDFFQIAAGQDYGPALFELAICFERGTGVVEKPKAAFELYMRAALAGEARAYYEVGRCWHYGIGIEASKRLAEVWLDRAKPKRATMTTKTPRSRKANNP